MHLVNYVDFFRRIKVPCNCGRGGRLSTEQGIRQLCIRAMGLVDLLLVFAKGDGEVMLIQLVWKQAVEPRPKRIFHLER